MPQYNRLLLEKRLKEGVEIDPASQCWNWRACGDANQYGKMRIRDQRLKTHRISAFLYLDFDPSSELHVLHKCDNRRCCNPDHLFLGTSADNAQDRERKGRGGGSKRLGENNGRAKVGAEDVRQIRTLRASGVTTVKIAEMFGISESMASYIGNGTNWKHIP